MSESGTAAAEAEAEAEEGEGCDELTAPEPESTDMEEIELCEGDRPKNSSVDTGAAAVGATAVFCRFALGLSAFAAGLVAEDNPKNESNVAEPPLDEPEPLRPRFVPLPLLVVPLFAAVFAFGCCEPRGAEAGAGGLRGCD